MVAIHKSLLTRLVLFFVGSLLLAGQVHAKNDKHDKQQKVLPPGLEKKVDRGGELPPGWKKKLRRGDILDWDIYRFGHKRPGNKNDKYEWIDIDNDTIKVIKNTREIVDILSR
ncbi:hypothetical protein [Motilimonas eburnea]|uniref:hypothetical protein n=1 Tax=Motilimonas eburnea TaxID=1737488 RepID=UPI001E37DF38|nr:hypothetical protein [Motilimonas eburnea]MCE2572417.1 hypothetical protein [Motilimonas eburnea]